MLAKWHGFNSGLCVLCGQTDRRPVIVELLHFILNSFCPFGFPLINISWFKSTFGVITRGRLTIIKHEHIIYVNAGGDYNFTMKDDKFRSWQKNDYHLNNVRVRSRQHDMYNGRFPLEYQRREIFIIEFVNWKQTFVWEQMWFNFVTSVPDAMA